ncbi:MAG: glycosyl hydrolase [Gemmatimonadetes bacterium]|nr:glycosyl hydrolase [Gemmatimonadota bacterium]
MRLLLCSALLASSLSAQPRPRSTPAADTTNHVTAETLSGLRFRSIGPAVTGGRIGEVVVDPRDPRTWYLAVHSGNVWKTTNAGTAWTPIFDGQGSYSIGFLALDPSDPLTVWVGTGENNSQRSVGYGDGVYRSTDGGRSWTNVGLKNSNHIGAIAVDPRDGKVVYVAATGPLWSAGGDRGVYKTTDGGKTWTQVLKPDNEWTGAQSLIIDPKRPDVLYASTHQRARRQWGFINGGPGSSLYKSTDGGSSWVKITKGLPAEELGKIGLAIAPSNPNVLYAIVEAQNRAGGLYRSDDGGQNWQRQSAWQPTSPMYYQKAYVDPTDEDRIYLMDTFFQVSEDGGRTVRQVQANAVHVDHHALWIDPADPRHLLLGNDGGLYESFDRGAQWMFRANLPITQFYKLEVDNATPFYNVCGGTQDNNTWCGPSQTINEHGATNFDWFVVVGGDGFQPRIDPTDPNIIYGQWQHGELVRFDKRTGERVEIQPQPEATDPPLKWHWDSPLLISPHANTRLYFAAQRVFRSDDRGDTWRPISGDLTRQIDRNRLEMMGRVWSIDAIAKNTSTSMYGTVVALSESPLKAGLLVAGSDDGLVHVTEDGGSSWRRVGTMPGVPDTTFVSDLETSRHDVNTIYAAFNHHKAGDYRPYLMKSTDLGRTWRSIASNLPERGSIWSLVEDHVDPNLLFVGTEFGLFVTVDGGGRWTQLKGGLPTIQIRDLAIQRRDNDLVVATFGRGFYILHDLTPLRQLARLAATESTLLPIREAAAFVAAEPLGGGAKGFLGDELYTAPNPAMGAAITYYLRSELKTRRARRQEAEKAAAKKDDDVAIPSWDELRREDWEDPPAAVVTIRDEAGTVVRRITGPVKAGFNRITWDLRHPPADPVTGVERQASLFAPLPVGPLVPPGRYRAQLALRVDGRDTVVGEQSFTTRPLHQAALSAEAVARAAGFNRDLARLQRAALGAEQALGEQEQRLRVLASAIERAAGVPPALREAGQALRASLRQLRVALSGDQTIASRNEATVVTIGGRVQRIVRSAWATSTGPTATHRRSYAIASDQLAAFLPQLRAAADQLRQLEEQAEAAGVPWTPGRIPSWRP